MESAFPAIGILAFVVFAILMMLFHFSRARSILERWAEENGYEIVSSERRWFGGTFWWRKSKGQKSTTSPCERLMGGFGEAGFAVVDGFWEC